MNSICCVLRSGGDFGPEHVEWLRKQCEQHMPGWVFVCWSDVDVPAIRAPLRHNWPKWWAKMEIYESMFQGSALVIDLDTVFLGTLEIKPEHIDEAIIIRDPWRDGFKGPERLGGGFMYLPKWARDRIWNAFKADPAKIIDNCEGDDQRFLTELFPDALRFQDHYLDQVVSYKAHVKGLGIQPQNKVVYFHGQPRPWDVKETWIPEI